MTRVLITGATGFVGRQLVARLTAAGHSCTALSRSGQRARGSVPGLVEAWDWSPREAPAPAAALADADAIVHLAGESVVGRWTRSKRERIKASRVEGTRNLIAGLAGLPATDRPRTLVSASAIGFYGDRGDAELGEDTTAGDDFLADVCQAWEAEAQRAVEHGLRVVNPRIGLVLDPAGGALDAMLTPFKLGLGGPLGGGRQWWSWIHLGDLLRVFEHALTEDDLRGPVNATSPRPERQGDFAKALGRALGRPAFLPGPKPALKLALGGFAVELLASRRVLPRVLEQRGFRFDHPELPGALADLLQPA